MPMPLDCFFVQPLCSTALCLFQSGTRAERLKSMHDEVAEKTADGQTFGEDGKPKTNLEGKKLAPADMFNPGDVITVTVGKSNPKQDAGLKVEEINGKYYVRKIPTSGLFARTPVIAGDKILELNGTDAKDFPTLNDMKKVIKDDPRITIVVLRRDPDASVSSASSVDYDNLAPVVAGPDSDKGDDDTVGYDGHDCGCVWCPECHGGDPLLLADGPADDSE
jgi:membrane-associated protease RseP (regulator of RpoE activity)